MNEMKTLTLNGKTYDSFPDQEARDKQPFWVTVTDNGDEPPTAEPGHAEILAAHNAGRTVSCKYGSRLYPLTFATYAACIFSGVNDVGEHFVAKISATGTVSVSTKEFSSGTPGVSCTHEWDGTVLTVTSASGTSSADLKGRQGETGPQGEKGATGSKGADGHTPVKGVDYFTAADKQELLSDLAASNGLPDYWQSHLDNRVEDIRRAMELAGRNKSSFFFYSDAHWDNDGTYTAKISPALLKYLHEKTPINKTGFGGDIVHGEGSTDTDHMKYLWDWRERLRDLPNHHSVIGNHDDGNGEMDRQLSKEYVYSYLFAPEASNDIVWGGDFYYYIDDQSERTRYLYLDIFYDAVSTAQQSFVKEAIKSVPENWHIVAICHAWFANDYSVYPPLLNGFATEMKPILDMFDSYNARSGDFGDCGGKVELCIGGHYHLDHYDFTDGGIPVIIVEADTLHNRSGSWPQKLTTDEASVNAVVLDYNNGVIKVIRIGRGNSFTIDMNSGEATVTYSITGNLTNVASSSAITSIEANQPYATTLTATAGTLTAVSVTMGGKDVTDTVYNAETGVISIVAVTGDIVITATAKVVQETTYTNAILTSIDTTGAIFNNGKGWANNSRIGSGGIYLGNGSLYVTGHISINPSVSNTIRLRNIDFKKTEEDTAIGFAFFDEAFERVAPDGSSDNWLIPGEITPVGGYAPVYDDENILEFTFSPSTHTTNTAVKYIAICARYIGDDSVITINEPIE